MATMKRMAAVLIGTWIAGHGAHAQELELIEKIGDWNLYYSEALGNSCLIERTDAAGRQFQIGVDRLKQKAYVGLFAKADSGLTAGKLQNVTIDLDGALYEGDAVEYSKGGIEGGYMYFNNLDFAYDVANKQTMKVTPAGGEPVTLDLTGSKAAMEWAIACQIATAQ